MPVTNDPYKERRSVYRPEAYAGQNYRESILGNLLFGRVPQPQPTHIPPSQPALAAVGPRRVYRKFEAPIDTIPVGNAMTGPLYSPNPQEQGTPPMAQSRLFPRAGYQQQRSPFSMPTMPSAPSQSGYGVPAIGMQRAQVPMAGPATQQSPFSRMVARGPGMSRQATSAAPPGHPLFGMNQSQMQKMVDDQYAKLGSPLPTAQEMGYVPQPNAPLPPAGPIGTRMVGGMELSGTNRPGMNALADSRLMPAQSREEGLARVNLGALGRTPTLAQAAADPNYNTNGALFQGAKLGMNPNGSAFFREGPRDPQFAGGAQTADEAAANRLAGMQAMEQRGVGYIDKRTGAFVGHNSKSGPDQIPGRLVAGGVSPSNMTPEQAGQNRLAYLQRIASRKESALAKVHAMAAQQTADRRERLNGGNPLQNLLRNNPQAALAFQAQQNQMQHQLALQQAENNGRLAVANVEGQNMGQRNQFGLLNGLVGNGMDPNEARRQAGLPGLPGGAPAPNAVPRFAAGAFGGADMQTYNYLKEKLKDLNDDDALSLMDEMGVPADLRPGLLDRAKPNWLRGLKKGADGKGINSSGFQMGPINWGPFGPRWNPQG